MNGPVLADTGPIVALISERDYFHDWALRYFKEIKPPIITCDAVLTEALYLLRGDKKFKPLFFGLLERGVIVSRFSVQDHAAALRKLMEKYADTPMDFGDACLVRMSELHSGSRVWTVDSDFLIYRRNGRARIPLIYPS